MSKAGQHDSGTEIRVSITDESYPFIGVSARQQCLLEYVALYPHTDGSRVIFRVTGAGGEAVIRDLRAKDIDCELLYRGDSESLVSLSVPELTRCPGTTTVLNGGIITTFRARDGEGEIRAFLPPDVDAAQIFAAIQQHHPSIDLLSKQEWSKSAPSGEISVSASVLNEDLTDRQAEALELAYENGYFDHPRRKSGEEIATELGISQSTFSEHLRAAQSKVLERIFGKTR